MICGNQCNECLTDASKKNVGSDRSVYSVLKRGCDIIFSVCGLIASFPLMLIIMLVIRMDSDGSVIYAHKRVGYLGKPLYVLKFRTMRKDADQMERVFSKTQRKEWQENYKLEDDPRITKVGRFLRKSSMDELPQLINVLKGEMSLIGPRPVIEEELLKYGQNMDLFLSVKPGLSGYWQAYARNDCSYERRMQMELEYAEKANFWWDVKILFATFGTVLRGKGAR